MAENCVIASAELAAAIVANPSDYYVNVHTPAYPGGAIRGQLGDWPDDLGRRSSAHAGLRHLTLEPRPSPLGSAIPRGRRIPRR